MATDVEALMLRIEASATKLERDMAKANGIFDKGARQMEQRAKQAGDKMKAGLEKSAATFGAGVGKLIGAVAATVGVTMLAAEIKRLADVADQSKKIGISAEALQAYQYNAKMAGSSSEEMTSALIRFSKEVGESGEKSSKLAQLFRDNGVAMRDSKGVLLPYNDLLEKFAGIVARAANDQDAAAIAAVGFGKAGAGMVPVLRDMAGGLSDVSKKAADAGVLVKNELVARADEFDDAWTTAIMSIKAGLASLVLEAAKARPFQTLQSDWAHALSKLPAAEVQAKFGNTDGLSDADLKARLRAKDALAAQLENGKTTPDLTGFDRVKDRRSKPPIERPKSEGETEDEYDREIRQIQEKTAALMVEIGLVGKSTLEAEKAREMQKLKTAADKADLELTPARLAEMDKTATAFAQQTAALEKAKDAHEAYNDLQKSVGDGMADFFTDITTGGKTAGEALAGLTKKLEEAAIRALILGEGPLAKILGLAGEKGAAGGLIGMMFKGFGFADGGIMGPRGPMALKRYASGGIANSPQLAMFGEGSMAEAYVPLPNGRAIPVDLRMPEVRSGAGGNRSTTVYNIDARGADQVAIAKLQAQIVSLQRGAGAAVDHRVQVNQVRGTRS